VTAPVPEPPLVVKVKVEPGDAAREVFEITKVA
jgi:hypothetical protein